jgi:hypothetical protein
MTISRELMLSIFSLDSYNRGYSVGMLVEGSGIGSASIASDEYTAAQQASSFYATAYTWNGETIISYRGTRFDGLAGPDMSAILNGWTLSLGAANASKEFGTVAISGPDRAEGALSRLSRDSHLFRL